MSMTLEQLVREARELSVEDRVALAEEMVASLGADTSEDDVLAAWIQEGEARLQEIESGKVPSLDGEEVMAAIRKRFSL